MIKGRLINLCDTEGKCHDLQFKWQIVVSGIFVHADDLRWEQFVSGGHDIFFEDNTKFWFSSRWTIPKVNPAARAFGDWIEDIVSDMPSGPKPLKVNGGEYGKCRPSGGSQKRRECGTYLFDDTPGFEKDIGDDHDMGVVKGTVRGVRWMTSFVHKLWQSGQDKPFYVIEFSLSGGMGIDKHNRPIPPRKIIKVSHNINEAMMQQRKFQPRASFGVYG